MWSAWDTDDWVPWWRRRWSDRPRAQRAVLIGLGLVVWFASVLAYGLAQREERVQPPATPAGAQAPRATAVAVPDPPVTTARPPTTTVTVPTVPIEQPAPRPEAEPAATERARPAPDPPRATNCDAVSDLGTAEPGGRVAFRLDPDCPFRPGSVSISVNGQPPQPAEVDENGVIWIEVAQ